MSSSALATSEPPTTAVPDWAGEIARLKAENAALKHQLEWFKRQLFGAKSERRHLEPPPEQMSLGEGFGQGQPAPATTRPVAAHERRRRQRGEAEEPALFFDPERVPVETITLPNPEIAGLPPEAYTVIGEKVTHRLAQRPGSYVVLKYVRPVVKLTHTATLSCPSAPPAVLEGGRADVSFLAGLVMDKFLYHLPLYRQHQRLAAAGIEVSRQWLTQPVLSVAVLLAPIVAAMLEDIRACRVKAMDETPIKAGRKGKGQMKTGWFWPVWGDTDDGGGGDIVFLFRASRAAVHVREALGERVIEGMVLLSDGYRVYAQYAAALGIALAQCWAHTRRGFERAKDIEPEAAAEALARIGELYRIETAIRTQGLAGEAKRAYRLSHAKPVAVAFFAWAEAQLAHAALLPSNPLTKALHYALERREGLSVYLDDPDVPIDTNHLERALRPIPMGRKSWLFCWSEVGAEAVAALQSLIVTCRLHDIDPYDYLVDVLQRIDRHPARDVHRLTPRRWKRHFAADPLRSDLHRLTR